MDRQVASPRSLPITTATQIPLIPREVHSIQEPSAVSARRCSDDTPFPVTVIADTA